MSRRNQRHFFYSRYGLQIDSTLECPGLKPGTGGNDIVIRVGEVPPVLTEPVAEGVLYQARPGSFLFTLDGIARYAVLDGQRIVVDAAPESDDESVRFFLLGPPMAALMQQRGLLVLHGSAITMDEEAVLFLGASGFGKSTLAAAFSTRGYQILSDDVCVIDLTEASPARLRAGGRDLKLWVDSVQELGLDPESLRRVRPEGRRRAFGSPADSTLDDLPIRHVYCLQPTQDEEVIIERLAGAARFRALLGNLYQHRYLDGHGKLQESFHQCGLLANQAPVSSVRRPVKSFCIEMLYDRIHADLT